jgi:RHS repeat-associated protein
LFAYDGLGRRIQDIELTNGVPYITNKFLWDGQALVEQRDRTGGSVTKRFFAQGEQISATNYYFTRDHLGSVREMVDSAGVIKMRYDYDPYGRQTKLSGTMDADFGYAGMFVHWPSGLNLTFYRAYSPDLGRWLSRDPLAEAAGLNLYAYVGNSPTKLIDVLGLCPGDTWDLFGNGLNNTLSAMGQTLAWYLGASGWTSESWNQIGDQFYSTATPENPAATPYVEGAFAVAAAAAITAAAVIASQVAVGEIGAKAFSDSTWTKMGLNGLSNYEKGIALIRQQGLWRAAIPTGRGLMLGIGSQAFAQGPTTAAWIFGPPAVALGAYSVYNSWRKSFGK